MRAPGEPWLLLTLLSFPWTPLGGQEPAGDTTIGPLVLERTIIDRWVFSGQHPGFVPFETRNEGIDLTLRVYGRGTPRRLLKLDLRGVSADLFLEPDNRVQSLSIDLPPRYVQPGQDEANRAETRRSGLRGQGNAMNLPEARFWEVPFVSPGAALAPGLQWTDTVSFVADPGDGLLQTMEQVRENEVLGDTLVEGRRLPLVRTRADVRYRSVERYLDYALEGDLVVDTEVSGVLLGRAAVDTVLGVRAVGTDSMRWEGTATLRTPDGRSFPAPVLYQGTRSWLLWDSASWGVARDSVRAREERQRPGIIAMPARPVEERLAAGDSALADSIRTAWRLSEDPNQRQELSRMLTIWWARGAEGPAQREWEHRTRLELGDTAGAVQSLLSSSSRPLTVDHLDLLLPYLDDLDRLWRLGVNPRFLYARLAEDLLNASPLLEPDSTRWPCAPAACRRLVALAGSAREPLLRGAALVGAFARDPTTWADSVATRASGGSIPARQALQKAAGVVSTRSEAPRVPVPETGADWRAWLSWMGGDLSFADQHRRALRFHAGAQGRDVVAELAAAWPPQGDSARLVMGTILREMEAIPPSSPEELAVELLSGVPVRVEGATRSVGALFRSDHASDAGRALALELLRPVLDSITAGGTAPWPSLTGAVPPAQGGVYTHRLSPSGIDGVPVLLIDDALPDGLSESLPQGIGLLSVEERQAWPRRKGAAFLRLDPVVVAGPFARVIWGWTVLQERAPDEAPRGHAQGESVYLLATEDGWRVVDRMFWIT